MTVSRGNDGAAQKGLRRARRAERKRAEKMVLRHRWYAGGVATLISAALIFTGVATPAMADTTGDTSSDTATSSPAPSAATTEAPVATPPADEPAPVDETATTQPTAPVETTAPADESAPAATTPAEESASPAPTASETVVTDESDTATTDDSAARVAAPEVVVELGKGTLKIKKLGKRFSADGGATVLAGATFYAIPGERGTPPPSVNVTSALTCTTTVIGCTIEVPARNGGSGASEQGYWVVEGASPDGYGRITQVGTGQHDGPKAATTYTFFTGPVQIGEVKLVTADATAYTNAAEGYTTPTTDEGGFVNVATNPGFPEACGMDVAIVFDVSNSINAADMTKMKAAASQFVGDDGLANTPSSVSVFAFNTTAGQLLGSTPILDEAGQAVVQGTIAALPGDGSGFTNWDDAFRKVAFNADKYDVVLFLTDGDPTTYGSGSDIQTNVSFRNVEEGVLSANAVKTQGTKVIGVGIGLQYNSYLNLQAISGPNEGSDYYLSDFDGLAAKLHDIAVANCGDTLTIIKKTVDAEGNVIDPTADGWTFTGSTAGNSIVGPNGPTNTLALTTGAVDPGSATFQLDFGNSSSRTVNIAEQLQAGFQPVGVYCTDGVEPVGPAGDFSVDIPQNGIIKCLVVNQQSDVPVDDVGIEKTATDLPEQGSVEPGDSFTYQLKVTNYGVRPAEGVRVTDSDLNERLTIDGLTVSPGVTWGPAPGYVGNVVDLTIAELGVGESATITVAVTFNAVPVNTDPLPAVVGDAPAPPAPAVLNSLTNTACVETALDPIDGPNGANNCATAEVPVRDISAILYTRCVGDAPLLGWTVNKSATLTAEPIDFLWTPLTGDANTTPTNVALTQPGGTSTWSEEIEWPGSAFTPSGISIDYPGWRPLAASDYAPGGGYYLPGTTTVMTPEQEAEFVFNGLILDPSELDFAWREASQVTFSVNPELTYDNVTYPTATPDCAVARHTDVQIEKTASVAKASPGDSFTYTIDATNVSDDSAADGVVITDAIPADLKITNVTWTGKSDAATFPNWESCAVTGQNSAGYGGTLSCTLFGPLQPAGANLGTSSAPQITLSATVHPKSTASVITNVAAVSYYTFGDPSDVGRDTDDAVVLLSGLPATGGSPATGLIALGLFGVIAGAATMLILRRRRGDAKPQI